MHCNGKLFVCWGRALLSNSWNTGSYWIDNKTGLQPVSRPVCFYCFFWRVNSLSFFDTGWCWITFIRLYFGFASNFFKVFLFKILFEFFNFFNTSALGEILLLILRSIHKLRHAKRWRGVRLKCDTKGQKMIKL